MLNKSQNHLILNNPLLNNEASNPYLKFQNYNICLNISPEQSEKRWSEGNKLQRTKLPWKNDEFQKYLKLKTTFVFKFYRVKIPKALKINVNADLEKLLEEKPELAEYNKEVTVFWR